MNRPQRDPVLDALITRELDLASAAKERGDRHARALHHVALRNLAELQGDHILRQWEAS